MSYKKFKSVLSNSQAPLSSGASLASATTTTITTTTTTRVATEIEVVEPLMSKFDSKNDCNLWTSMRISKKFKNRQNRATSLLLKKKQGEKRILRKRKRLCGKGQFGRHREVEYTPSDNHHGKRKYAGYAGAKSDRKVDMDEGEDVNVSKERYNKNDNRNDKNTNTIKADINVCRLSATVLLEGVADAAELLTKETWKVSDIRLDIEFEDKEDIHYDFDESDSSDSDSLDSESASTPIDDNGLVDAFVDKKTCELELEQLWPKQIGFFHFKPFIKDPHLEVNLNKDEQFFHMIHCAWDNVSRNLPCKPIWSDLEIVDFDIVGELLPICPTDIINTILEYLKTPYLKYARISGEIIMNKQERFILTFGRDDYTLFYNMCTYENYLEYLIANEKTLLRFGLNREYNKQYYELQKLIPKKFCIPQETDIPLEVSCISSPMMYRNRDQSIHFLGAQSKQIYEKEYRQREAQLQREKRRREEEILRYKIESERRKRNRMLHRDPDYDSNYGSNYDSDPDNALNNPSSIWNLFGAGDSDSD